MTVSGVGLSAFAALMLLFSGGPVRAAQDLIVLSPHSEEIRKEFADGFNRWHSAQYGKPVNVRWLDQGGSSDNLKFMLSRFQSKPDGIGVDVFFGGGVDPYRILKEKGLLKGHKPAARILDRIPPDINGVALRDADFRWHGACLSGFGIVTNERVRKLTKLPEARTWADLARPEMAGWVGSADPRHSGSAHMMYEIILQARGWEEGWRTIAGIGANVKSFAQSSSKPVNDALAGDIAFAMTIDSAAYSAMRKAPKGALSYVFPKGASATTPDPVAILKGAPNHETAKRFLFYVLSLQGQKLWMYKVGTEGGPREFSLNRLSVTPELYRRPAGLMNASFNPFSEGGRGIAFDDALSSRRYAALNDMIGALVIDSQDKLKAAVKKRGGSARWFVPPASERELLSLADRWADDASVRNERIAAWLAYADKAYR